MTQTQLQRVAPGPRGNLLLGSLPDYQRDPLNLFMNAALEYGGIVRFRMGPRNIHLITDPDSIKYVLQDNNRNYHKSVSYEKTKPMLGEGLLTSEDDFWRRQRKLAQPAFHRQRIGAFATTMTEATATMLDRWQSAAEQSQPLDIAREMMRLTLTIVGLTLFSSDVSGAAETVGRALTVALEHTNQRMQAIFDLGEKLPTRENRRFAAAIQMLDRVVYGMIEQRRRSGEDTGDLLSMLLHSTDAETGESMSDRQLRDEAMTIFLAGHETTANALAWTWYLLSKHPEVARRLRAEVDQVLGDRVPTIEDLPRLRYTEMVLYESMRLYPPAWAIGRNSIAADEIGGCSIPPDSIIALSPYVTHRLPAYWDNPEGFDPDRFTPERSAGRPRFAYFPFGGGPRLCIGNNFAMMEAQLVVAMVAQRYRLELVPGQIVDPEPMITLRPRNGVLMTVKGRMKDEG